MAKNEVYRVGQYFPLPVPATLTGTPLATAQAKGLSSTPAGTPLRIGGLNVITVTERSDTEKQFGNHAGESSVDAGGAHKVPVTVVTSALTAGQPIYITAANALTTVASGNTLWGHALEYGVAVGADKPVTVRIAN